MRILVLVGALMLLSACESKTEFGDCIGAFDDKNPELEYKVSKRNIIIGAVFCQMIAPPLIVGLTETYCPVAKK